MPKTKSIKFAGKNIVVSEISVTRIYQLLQGEQSILNLPLPVSFEKIRALIPLAIDTDIQELLQEDIYSDDIDRLIEAFKETNPVFLTTARTLKLDSVLVELISSLLINFSSKFAGLLQPGMVPPSGNTDMDTSSTV